MTSRPMVSASRKSMPRRQRARNGNHSSPISHRDHADIETDQVNTPKKRALGVGVSTATAIS